MTRFWLHKRNLWLGLAMAALCSGDGSGVRAATEEQGAVAVQLKPPGLIEEMPEGISVKLSLSGAIFTDEKGMTLYRWAYDTDGTKTNCNDVNQTHAYHAGTDHRFRLPYPFYGTERRTCVQKWPPAEPVVGASPVGKWTIFTRLDGRKQWSYAGRPVYRSSLDLYPGDTSSTEDDRTPVLAPVHMPNGIRLLPTPGGLALVDRDNYTLYTSAKDAKNKSNCDMACSRTWPPVIAAAGSVPQGAWTLITRDDGQRQWAFEGRPLYRYAADEAPNFADGHKVPGWSAAVLIEPPSPPEGIQVRATPDGLVYVDRHGMTIYKFTCHEETKERLTCDRQGDTGAYLLAQCGGTARCADMFRMIKVTDPNAKENALWKIRTVDLNNPLRVLRDGEQGTRVWFYNGLVTFTFGYDTAPGDIFANGIRLQAISEVLVLSAYGGPEPE